MTDARNDAVAVTTRTTVGTTATNKLRHLGKIPAVLSGHGSAPLSIAIDAKRFDELLASGARHHLLHVTIDGKAKDTAVIRDVERDALTRRIIHADLQRVQANEAINATLNLVVEGIPAGVKSGGGVLEVMSRDIEVRGPADSVPESLRIDVSGLELHQNVHASDIALPAGFELVTAAETVIAAVTPPRTQTEEPTPAASDVPVVGEGSAQAESGS